MSLPRAACRWLRGQAEVRRAPPAEVVSGFNRAFHDESRQTPYPVEEIHRVGAEYGLALS
ncbi:hypothetical protein [Streptomyces sp. CA-288835]|uniref:hypothetical protein n=1 Tax=Streptomyces sp. CA-288835 TaxID=3240069 RepID=UPI003D941BD7